MINVDLTEVRGIRLRIWWSGLTPRRFAPKPDKILARPWREFLQDVRHRIAQGRRGQIFRRLRLVAARAKPRVNVQLELHAKLIAFSRETERVEEKQQRFDGGEFALAVLRTKPIATRPGHRQIDFTSPPFDLPHHLRGLRPVAIEEQNLQVRWPFNGRRGLARRVENPERLARLHDRRPVERAFAAVNVLPGCRDHPMDQMASAAGPVGFHVMHEDIHLDRAIDFPESVADAPAELLLAPFAARSLVVDDTSPHAVVGAAFPR